MRKDVEFAHKGALVKRFHTYNTLRQETNGHHSWSVATLLHLLHPTCRKELITAALLHDLAERRTGDIPGDVKRQLDIRDAVKGLETVEFAAVGLEMPELTPEEERALKFADMLAGVIYILEEMSRGNIEEMTGPLINYMSWLEGASDGAKPVEREMFRMVERKVSKYDLGF